MRWFFIIIFIIFGSFLFALEIDQIGIIGNIILKIIGFGIICVGGLFVRKKKD